MKDNPKVDDLFGDALELPYEKRAEFLDRVCGRDTDLRRLVDGLLQAHASATGFLAEGEVATTSFVEREMVGMTIGAYELTRHIGSGGMGAVFEARRADQQFEHRVAIKLIKPGVDNADIIQRFHLERQLLANLQHSYIARLLDGGETDDGRPFLVMEYVEGEQLTTYCSNLELSVRQRLALFLQIVRAVGIAHQQLVIHGDLKPGNILVESSETEGSIKLLDFGIARVIQRDTASAGSSHSALFSPSYASPEQIRGETLTTASDIFSLGVILYELLSDSRPYSIDGDSLSVRNRKSFCPSIVPPSDRSSESRARELRGELDAIILKSLSNDTQCRYSTAEELRADIERFLCKEPVRALPQTNAYRLRKFIQRHRQATALTAIAGLALILAVTASSWGWLVASRANSEARREADTARAMNKFLTDMFASPDPWAASDLAMRRDVKIIDFLDTAVAKLDTDFANRPLVRAELELTIGRTYRDLGELSAAEPLLRSAMNTFREKIGDGTERSIEAAQHWARLLSQQNRDEEAHIHFTQCYEDLLTLNGSDHVSTLQARRDLIGSRAALGNVQQARVEYEELLDHQLRVLGDDHLATLKTKHCLGTLLSELDLPLDAEPHLRAALAGRKHHLGSDHPSTLTTKMILAQTLRQTGRLNEAEPLFREVLRVYREVLGDSHPSTLTAWSTLGMLLYSKGELEESIGIQERLVDQFREIRGDDHPATISALANLATLRMNVGEYDKALTIMNEAIAHSVTASGVDHPETLHCKHTLGIILIRLGEFSRAEETLIETVNARKRVLGNENPLTLSSMNNLCYVQGSLDRWPEAEACYREVLSKRERSIGQDHRDTLTAAIGLGNALKNAGKIDQALTLYEYWRPRAMMAETEGDWLGTQLRFQHGESLMLSGSREEASIELQAVQASFISLLGADHQRTKQVRQMIDKLNNAQVTSKQLNSP